MPLYPYIQPLVYSSYTSLHWKNSKTPHFAVLLLCNYTVVFRRGADGCSVCTSFAAWYEKVFGGGVTAPSVHIQYLLQVQAWLKLNGLAVRTWQLSFSNLSDTSVALPLGCKKCITLDCFQNLRDFWLCLHAATLDAESCGGPLTGRVILCCWPHAARGPILSALWWTYIQFYATSWQRDGLTSHISYVLATNMTEILYQLHNYIWDPLVYSVFFRSLRLIQKNLVYFCPSVCPLFNWHVSAWLPTDGFRWQLILGTFWKSVQKLKICLNANKNIGHFTWRPTGLSLLAATNCCAGLSIVVLLTMICTSTNTHRTYCCFTTTQMVPRTRTVKTTNPTKCTCSQLAIIIIIIIT